MIRALLRTFPFRLPASLALLLVLASCRSSKSGPAPGTPAAPSDLTARLQGGTQARLDWIDNSDDEDAFVVRATGAGKDWADIATVPAGTTTWLSPVLQRPSKTYTFVVYAKNEFGQSPTTNRAEVTTPGYGGGGGCGIILSEGAIGTPRPGVASGETGNPTLCLFQPDPKSVQIDDVRGFASDGGDVLLRGRDGDSVMARVRRSVAGSTVVVEGMVTWHEPPPVEEWEVCFAIHDPSVLDIRSQIGRHGLSAWTPQRVAAPVLDRLPIAAEQPYAVRFVIDTARRTYSAELGGVRLAADVGLDRILVLPVQVLWPVPTR